MGRCHLYKYFIFASLLTALVGGTEPCFAWNAAGAIQCYKTVTGKNGPLDATYNWGAYAAGSLCNASDGKDVDKLTACYAKMTDRSQNALFNARTQGGEVAAATFCSAVGAGANFDQLTQCFKDVTSSSSAIFNPQSKGGVVAAAALCSAVSGGANLEKSKQCFKANTGFFSGFFSAQSTGGAIAAAVVCGANGKGINIDQLKQCYKNITSYSSGVFDDKSDGGAVGSAIFCSANSSGADLNELKRCYKDVTNTSSGFLDARSNGGVEAAALLCSAHSFKPSISSPPQPSGAQSKIEWTAKGSTDRCEQDANLFFSRDVNNCGFRTKVDCTSTGTRCNCSVDTEYCKLESNRACPQGSVPYPSAQHPSAYPYLKICVSNTASGGDESHPDKFTSSPANH